MLIYVEILKSSDHLDILQADAYMPTLHNPWIFLQYIHSCAF